MSLSTSIRPQGTCNPRNTGGPVGSTQLAIATAHGVPESPEISFSSVRRVGKVSEQREYRLSPGTLRPLSLLARQANTAERNPKAMNRSLHAYSRFGPAAVISVLVLGLAPPQAPGQESDQTLAERFLQEAPPRWEEYVRLTGELQGVATLRTTSTAEGVRLIIQEWEYKINRTSKLLKFSRRDERAGGKEVEMDEEVFGVNPLYAFVLRRKTPEAPWVVTALADLSYDTVPKQIDKFITIYLTSATPGALLVREPLADVVRSPGFHVERCHPVRQGGEDLVEVAFRYTKEEKMGPWTQTGTLLFDPNRQWRLRSGDLQYSGQGQRGTVKIRVIETETVASSPLSRVYEVDNEFVAQGGGGDHQTIRMEATLSRPKHLPADEEFTLSAFGLPEPPGIRRPVPWYLWAAVAGLLLLGAGAIFRYLKYRSTQTSSAA